MICTDIRWWTKTFELSTEPIANSVEVKESEEEVISIFIGERQSRDSKKGRWSTRHCLAVEKC